MTKEQFENKYVGKAVHCDTEEKAKEFLALAHSFGWSWISGRNFSEITYWHEHKENTCYRIDNDKTVCYARLDFYKSEGWEIVKFESEEKKMKKTKRVFDLGLFVEWAIENKRTHCHILEDIEFWAFKFHGKTEEELRKDNKHVLNEWMKEVEVKVELSEKEIEILKALKVLGFKWIGRDENNSLNAYCSKPIKKEMFFYVLDVSLNLDKDLFSFITWQDKEPTSIDELLKNA